MKSYTIGIIIGANDSKIFSRIVRDLIALKSKTDVERTQLRVACFSNLLDDKLSVLGIERTPDMGATTYIRLYYSGEPVDIPEYGETEVELVQVDPPPPNVRPLRKDSWYPDVRFTDQVHIGPTIDLTKPPPTNKADPWSQDF